MVTPDFDPRLQLLRREVFDRDVSAYTTAALDTHDPVALIMIDLDRFKSINDQHGHQVGDEVLEKVAGSIRRVVGSKGTSYRYGGDELCVLLVNYTADEGATLAERIREHIERENRQLRVTASFGVAEFPAHAHTAEQLVKKADEAMYEATNLGRNLVRISGEPPPAAPGPRAIARRQPEPGSLSDEQAEAIRHDYFRRGGADCPFDGGRLTVRQVNPLNRRTPTLSVSCPLCGLTARLDGPS